MPRNRINYPVEALYVGPSPATGNHFGTTGGGVGQVTLVNRLFRVQSCNYSWAQSLTDVNQLGETASIDRIATAGPDVSLDFTYLLSSLINESGLGFNTNGTVSVLSGILTQVSDEKNYFLKINPEGVDANASTLNNSSVITMGVGNGFISSYSVQGAVGGLPTVSVNVVGLNMAWTTGNSGIIPAVNPTNGVRSTNTFLLPNATGSPGTGNLAISVLRPGDITLSFARAIADGGGVWDAPGADITDIKAQSFNLSFDLNREAIEKLGSLFAYTRQPQFPVNVSLSVDAIAGDIGTGDLSTYLLCGRNYDAEINIRKPDCALVGTNRPVTVKYQLKNAKLDSQNYSSAVNGNKTVTFNLTSQIGGINDNTRGLFISGVLLEGGLNP